MTTSAILDRTENAWSFGKRLLEPKRDATERFLNRVEFALEKHSPFVKDRDTIGEPFDFIQQVRGEENSSTFIGNRLDNRSQNIATHYRIEPNTRTEPVSA
jgi:hypothetical protein